MYVCTDGCLYVSYMCFTCLPICVWECACLYVYMCGCVCMFMQICCVLCVMCVKYGNMNITRGSRQGNDIIVGEIKRARYIENMRR